MLYVDLPKGEIVKKIVGLGLKKTKSQRFCRYEIGIDNLYNKVGVEISKYHNIYELCCYTIDSEIAPLTHEQRNKEMETLNKVLVVAFGGYVVANE